MSQKIEYVRPGIVAAKLGVTPTTVKNWYVKGRIKGRTLPSGHIQVEVCDGTVVTVDQRSDGGDGRVSSGVREAESRGTETDSSPSVPTPR